MSNEEPCTETNCSAQTHPASEGHIVRTCSSCGHQTENPDGVCGPCRTVGTSPSSVARESEVGELERLRAEVERLQRLADASVVGMMLKSAEAALTRVREVRDRLQALDCGKPGVIGWWPQTVSVGNVLRDLDAALAPASPAGPPTVEQADRAAVVVAMTKAATGLGWFPWTAQSSADEVTVAVQSEPPPTHSERLATLRNADQETT